MGVGLANDGLVSIKAIRDDLSVPFYTRHKFQSRLYLAGLCTWGLANATTTGCNGPAWRIGSWYTELSEQSVIFSLFFFITTQTNRVI